MEAAHAAEAGSWRSCRNLPRVAHENQEGKCLAPAKVLHGPLVLRLSVMPAGKEETCKGLRSIPTEQAVKGISGTKRQKLITGTTLFSSFGKASTFLLRLCCDLILVIGLVARRRDAVDPERCAL